MVKMHDAVMAFHDQLRDQGLGLDLGGCVLACRGVEPVVPVSVELVAV